MGEQCQVTSVLETQNTFSVSMRHGVLALEQALQENTSLRCINVLGSKLEIAHANLIGAVLEKSKTLKSVCGFREGQTEADLSRQGLTVEDAMLVAFDLKQNTTLTSLDISHNDLVRGSDSAGVFALGRAFKDSGLLTSLSLDLRAVPGCSGIKIAVQGYCDGKDCTIVDVNEDYHYPEYKQVAEVDANEVDGAGDTDDWDEDEDDERRFCDGERPSRTPGRLVLCCTAIDANTLQNKCCEQCNEVKCDKKGCTKFYFRVNFCDKCFTTRCDDCSGGSEFCEGCHQSICRDCDRRFDYCEGCHRSYCSACPHHC